MVVVDIRMITRPVSLPSFSHADLVGMMVATNLFSRVMANLFVWMLPEPSHDSEARKPSRDMMGSVAPGHLVWGTSWYLFRTTSEPASWQLGYHVHTSARDRGASGKQQRIHKVAS